MSRTLATLLAFSSLLVAGCGAGDPDGTGGAGGSPADGGACSTEDQVIKLGKLVDPADGTVIEKAIVVVRGDRIRYVGTDVAQIPCGATVIDWTAFTGLPGLVDVHTHFAYQTDGEPGTFPRQRLLWLQSNAPLVLMDLARRAALATIEAGVTTAVDKGAGNSDYIVRKLREETASGEIPGPRLFIAGKGISPPIGTLDDLRVKVQQQVLGGVDLVKVWADGCSEITLECPPSLTMPEIQAVVDAAHAMGRPVAVHAYHADTARLAIAAGADSIEHPEGLGPADFADLIARGATYVPTIDHNRYYKDNLAMFGDPASAAAELDAYIALNVGTAGLAHQAGVKIAMGSDAVFTGFGQNTRELTWLVKAGMTPLEALRAATIRGAESIGVQDRIGRVAEGYYADLIAVEGDPLADVDVVVNGVREVMKGGQWLKL